MLVSDYILQARTVWVWLIDTNPINHEERKWFNPGIKWDGFVDAGDKLLVVFRSLLGLTQ